MLCMYACTCCVRALIPYGYYSWILWARSAGNSDVTDTTGIYASKRSGSSTFEGRPEMVYSRLQKVGIGGSFKGA